MNQDAFNMSIRKFLKRVGVHSQREIEMAVEKGMASGKLKGDEVLPVKMTLTLGGGTEVSVSSAETYRRVDASWISSRISSASARRFELAREPL